MADDNRSNVLYINLIVHSVSEAIRNHVAKKLEKAKGIPNAMVNKAAATAAELASPKHVTQALGDEICARMPEELKKKGIFARMEFVFHENRFAVLELTIVYVNPLALASAWGEAGVSCFLCCIGPSNRKYFEEEYLPGFLTSTIAVIIPEILGSNIAHKKIDAETKVNKASEQASYFFKTLNRLRIETDEKRSNRNPILKIRKRISSQSSVGSGSRGSSRVSLGSKSRESHRRRKPTAPLNMKRMSSASSVGNASAERSMYSIDDVDDETASTISGASSQAPKTAAWF